jgi:hypothetical protein
MSSFLELVKVPADPAINTGIDPCPTPLIERKFGLPVNVLTSECAPVEHASAAWRKRFVTADVGPFRATGHKAAVALLTTSLSVVRSEKPKLYSALGSAGMLCMRHVRGVPGLPSNHCFGLAIDFLIEGKLDRRGDGLTYEGLLELYSIMKRFGWFWGAEFGTEDAMHFEVGSRVVRDWIAKGVF